MDAPSAGTPNGKFGDPPGYNCSGKLGAACDQNRVQPTEGEGVRHQRLRLEVFHTPQRQGQVALWVGTKIGQNGRRHAVTQCEHAEEKPHCAGRAEGMAVADFVAMTR